jgi:hypothetical protein
MLMRIYPQSCTTCAVDMLLPSNDGVTITKPIITVTIVVVTPIHPIFKMVRLSQEL